MKEKAVVYVTKNNKILVFTHKNHPQARVQVPKGTIEIGEEPSDAAIRELFEETGLKNDNQKLVSYLGCAIYRRLANNEEEKRHFFWFEADENIADSWEHIVSAGDEDKGLIFECTFVPIESAKIDLELDIMLSKIEQS